MTDHVHEPDDRYPPEVRDGTEYGVCTTDHMRVALIAREPGGIWEASNAPDHPHRQTRM